MLCKQLGYKIMDVLNGRFWPVVPAVPGDFPEDSDFIIAPTKEGICVTNKRAFLGYYTNPERDQVVLTLTFYDYDVVAGNLLDEPCFVGDEIRIMKAEIIRKDYIHADES